jgi:DNA-binding transcriptional MerR regulator
MLLAQFSAQRDADRRRQFNRRDAPLRHFVTYGRTNKYMPVKNIKASAATAKRPIQLVYLCLNTATPLKMTTSVKAMDSQRCHCRTHLLQFTGTSSHRTSAKFRSQCTRAQLLRTGGYTQNPGRFGFEAFHSDDHTNDDSKGKTSCALLEWRTIPAVSVVPTGRGFRCWFVYPALKRRAIFSIPFGTWNLFRRRELIPPGSRGSRVGMTVSARELFFRPAGAR